MVGDVARHLASRMPRERQFTRTHRGGVTIEVEAVEVYPGRDDLPYRYRVRPGRKECGGAVFVWTTR
jgi:hypothetical protein